MDKKFLNRVLGQLVNETMVDNDKKELSVPFWFQISPPFNPYFGTYGYFSSNEIPIYILPGFVNHCKDVYGLTYNEIDYIWKEYRIIIRDEIQSLH